MTISCGRSHRTTNVPDRQVVRRLYLPFVDLKTTLLRGMVVKQLRQVEFIVHGIVGFSSKPGQMLLFIRILFNIRDSAGFHCMAFLLKSHFHNQ
ncbi:hypothetical protein T4E_8867 [Trichinella pseudospiralis]|uniref:Uncharacterized protein n=1 Tax=Trichinella pseudospiralis TaxID=6337 RepID=A0A0V0YIU7_TRIPS|nr:hypothetical protein T4E_8867 [Trichinella pseudospiralis]